MVFYNMYWPGQSFLIMVNYQNLSRGLLNKGILLQTEKSSRDSYREQLSLQSLANYYYFF